MSSERRRSPRLAIRAFLLAKWKVGEETIVRNAVTESINAHGALLTLMAEHVPDDRVTLVNVINQEEQRARVVGVQPDGSGTGTYRMRVEFEVPAPQFWWRVCFHSRDEDFEPLYAADGFPDAGFVLAPLRLPGVHKV
jgi:hypothetical protein